MGFDGIRNEKLERGVDIAKNGKSYLRFASERKNHVEMNEHVQSNK